MDDTEKPPSADKLLPEKLPSASELLPEVVLASGQTARISEGRVQIVPPAAAHHYKLVAEHKTTGELNACCGDYDSLILFLKQLEGLDYRLRSLERQTGVVPSVQFSN